MPVQEENQDTRQMVIVYVTILWNRKFWFILPLLLGMGCAIAYILVTPKSYQSITTILVEEQKVTDDLVASTVSEPITARLSTIRQQILSRPFLKRVIDHFGLYKEMIASTEAAKIDKMKKNIEIKTVGADYVQAFSISFIANNPMLAMEVANELASLFIKENIKFREQLMEGATDFIDGESINLKKTLEQQEHELTRFKETYAGELPEQMDAALRTLDRLQLSLQTTKAAIKTIRSMKTAERVEQRVDPLLQSWQDQKQKLTTLQRKYKDNHPDVLALKKDIKELEDQVTDQGKKGASHRDGSELPLEFLAKSENSVELADLREREQKTEAQIQDLERRVENMPKREQQLAILLRDYDNTKANYQTLLDKKLTAKISENLEKRQKGGQFRIVDPGNFPEEPYRPNPIKVGLIGTALGIMMGLGLVFLRETMDSSIRTPEELEKIASAPVLASILDYSVFSHPLKKAQNKQGKAKPPVPV